MSLLLFRETVDMYSLPRPSG